MGHREIVIDYILSFLGRNYVWKNSVTCIRRFIHPAGLYFHRKPRSVITPTSLNNVPDLNSVTNYCVCQVYFNLIKILFRPTAHDSLNPLKPELNPICYLLALLAHHFLHVSRIRVKSLTIRILISYIYGAPILDVSRSHTTTQHSR